MILKKWLTAALALLLAVGLSACGKSGSSTVKDVTGIPVIAGEEGICQGCGVATLSVDYYNIGVTTGKMAIKILQGEDPKNMPVEYTESFVKKFVKNRADTMKLTVPEDYVEISKKTDSADPLADIEKVKATKTFNIGICQLVQHVALDAATKGFKDALTTAYGDKVKFNEQNAQGDSNTCATICNDFVSKKVDLIMANATPALVAASQATDSIPVVGTAVTEYGTALGIDDFKGTVGTNVTGVSDLAPLDKQADMLEELCPVDGYQKVGLIYCSAEANSQYQVDTIKKHLEDKGYKCTYYTFADSNDISSVVTTAADESDVLYVPTDNTAASNAEIINNICSAVKK